MTFSYHTITFIIPGTLLWKMRGHSDKGGALHEYKWNILSSLRRSHNPLPKNERPTTKVLPSSIIFQYAPTIDTEKKSILGELLTILHLHLEIGKAWFMNGPACIFSGHWHQSLFRQKLKEREKAWNMELECDLDCNLSRENN